jgi:DNA-binding NarL/FixJ family response regulator
MVQIDGDFTDAAAGLGLSHRLRVMLVEDHAILRQGLKALLETDSRLQIVGEAGTAAEALTAINLLNPALVITDIGLPGQSGIELIAALHERRPEIPILVLTAQHSEICLHAALRAGARGFILKDASRAELVEGLLAVAAGQKFLCAALSGGILRDLACDMKEEEDTAPMLLITRREREVLTRIAMGQSNKESARDLCLSVKTVAKHRSNLMRKLKLHNSAAVTMFALRHGLVDGESRDPARGAQLSSAPLA